MDLYEIICYNAHIIFERIFKMKRFISLFLAIFFVLALSVTASARLVGDVDSDGITNSTDALMILRYAVNKPSDKMNIDYADVNGDGGVNSTDALIVLQITVGKYKGDLEVDDKFTTSYKAQLVDPIMKTRLYTLVTRANVEGMNTLATFMVDGNDMCVNTVADGITVRVLVLSGKTYLVIPTDKIPFFKGFYSEMEEDLGLDTSETATLEYVKSEYVTIKGVEYVCENYKHPDGTITQYYFKDGKWAMMGTVTNGAVETQEIVEFKAGVDKSLFTIDGYMDIGALPE